MKVFVGLVVCFCCGLSTFAQTPPKVHLEKYISGLDAPVYFASDGTDRQFIVEQPGRIKIVRDGQVSPKPYLDIRKQVDLGGEKGLLSVAFHPQFATNGYFYVDFTTNPTHKQVQTIIAEFHVDPKSDVVDPATERVLLTIDQLFPNHKGGQLQFGPDGFLYIAMGDGGKHDDPFNNAQNKHVLLGKILRIDVNNRDPYGIPKDNPFADGKDGAPEVFAYGLRNPWRFSFDSKTNLLYAGDVGQDWYEEVDIVTKGGNYGWRVREGLHPNPTLHKDQTIDGPVIDPIAEYIHSDKKMIKSDRDICIIGGYVYRGKKYPSMDGWYFYSDYSSGRLWGLKYEDGKTLASNVELLRQDTTPSSFGVDVEGEIYLMDYSHGKIWKVVGEEK